MTSECESPGYCIAKLAQGRNVRVRQSRKLAVESRLPLRGRLTSDCRLTRTDPATAGQADNLPLGSLNEQPAYSVKPPHLPAYFLIKKR